MLTFICGMDNDTLRVQFWLFTSNIGANELNFLENYVFSTKYDSKIELKTVVEEVLDQVPFWWKWVINGFEVVIGQKIFWQNFGWFGPFTLGVTQRSSRGQNFKMLQMTFHVYQITREVIRITKIYSLPCVGCMVREILTKGHQKVK